MPGFNRFARVSAREINICNTKRLICNTNFQRLPACNTKRDLRNTKFQVFEKPRNFVLQNGSSEFNSPKGVKNRKRTAIIVKM